MFLENVSIAIRAIRANKMRSVLTVLGVMIGVAAVITVVSIIQGFQHKIAGDLNEIGAGYIEVFPQGDRRKPFDVPELTIEDAVAVRRQTAAIREFTPLYMSSAQLKNGDAQHSAQIIAVNRTYPEILNHWVERGRFFTPVDEEQKKRVCVIGLKVAEQLELGDNPVGRTVQVDSNTFTVVGVLETKGGMMGQNRDDIVIIPFSTATVVYGTESMRRIALAFQIDEGTELQQVKTQVRDILRARHGLKKGEKDDFLIMAQEELLKVFSTILGGATAILGGIVAIALLVGGIGIMNIMLVSVTERTREIGIRKSIGARRKDVLVQFLIEAIVLSGFGGLIGIAGGFVAARFARWVIGRWVEFPAAHTPLWAVVVSFTFCALLGIIFGIYPAAKASKLDPIEALRYE